MKSYLDNFLFQRYGNENKPGIRYRAYFIVRMLKSEDYLAKSPISSKFF